MSQGGATCFVRCVENGGNVMRVLFDMAGSQNGIIVTRGPDIIFWNSDCSLFIRCKYSYLDLKLEWELGKWVKVIGGNRTSRAVSDWVDISTAEGRLI